MAEIRKHNPTVTNAIDKALLDALGERVEPVTPGKKAAPKPPKEDHPHGVTLTGLNVPEGTYLEIQPRNPWRPQGTQPVERPRGEES